MYRLEDLVIPPALRPGDTVAIVSPSAPGPAWWPHRLDRARGNVESLGLRVRVMRHATERAGWVSTTAYECAPERPGESG